MRSKVLENGLEMSLPIKALYASEADMLNVALFGKTAKEWRDESSIVKGNIRDEATLEQLIVLSNMESINALLVKQGAYSGPSGQVFR